MEVFYNIVESKNFLMCVAVMNIVIFLLYISNCIKLKKLNKSYRLFMKKLGNGNDLEEILKKYIQKVEEVEEKNDQTIQYCNKLEKEVSLCLKKFGMVRYSAFKNTGSDLSFALALLNEKNDGVILNGIYSREMSNIYAKQVKEGKTNYKLSEEEVQALEIAINQ